MSQSSVAYLYYTVVKKCGLKSLIRRQLAVLIKKKRLGDEKKNFGAL